MQLKHITYTSCPDCKAKLMSVTIDHLHCNGLWNESVVFDCGRRDHFYPNSGDDHRSIKVEVACPKSRKIITFDLSIRVEVTCNPDVRLQDVELVPLGDARFYWDHIFKLPYGCEATKTQVEGCKKVK